MVTRNTSARIGLAVLLSVVVGGLSGCGTFRTLDSDDPVYGGVRHDLNLAGGYDEISGENAQGGDYGWWAFAGLVDLPFSYVADTLLQPWTFPDE